MTDSSKPESKAGSSNLRQLLLIGLLVLLVIGLIYDYTVARPGVNDAYDKITEQSMLTNMSSTNVFTNTDVQDLLKKAPSRTFEEPNGDFVEGLAHIRSSAPDGTVFLQTAIPGDSAARLEGPLVEVKRS